LPLVVVGAVPVLPPPRLQAASTSTRRRLHRLNASLEREKNDGERWWCG